ncbi:MAG: hypothetical protein OEX77_05550 [Candidatus Bathyarchaeota archaeon]|nr:hypothetical protein [Candidatus Bathyarchaeota archaeon]
MPRAHLMQFFRVLIVFLIIGYYTTWHLFPVDVLAQEYTNPYKGKPLYPIKIFESDIPVGNSSSHQIFLQNYHTYHVYCYGEWVDYGSDPETDYDIYVYDPEGELVASHTEAAGLPEHLGTTVDQPFFTPQITGDYSFTIKNDPRESEGAKEATLMVIEHIECGQLYTRNLKGKVDGEPVEGTSWAYEFCTDSKHIEVWIDVPDSLDMYEARLYPMANPSKNVGITLNGVPLALESGLYGELTRGYGGYNLNSTGFRNPDAMASCEYPGQDMLINYTHPDSGNTLYHLVLIAEDGEGEISFRVKTDFSPRAYNPSHTTFLNKPVSPVKIEDSQIPIGEDWTYVYSLTENRSYHVYCYGDWIDEGRETAKTDYDIYVYDPQDQLVSSHTESAGLPEHLGTTVDQPFFTPQKTGNYSFTIRNDPRESDGEKDGTFMVIEHVDCNTWHQRYLQGKVNSRPVTDTGWAYEFYTNSNRIEIWINVPDSLDMYETRLYLMANPSRDIGTTLNEVPLAWEPGLYGSLRSIKTPQATFGGFNLDDRGYKNLDAMASCEYAGQDMLINYTSPYKSDFILYHLVLLAESGQGNVRFMVKTDFDPPQISLIDPIERAYPSHEATIMANVSDETKLERVWLAYTADNWLTSTSVDMDETQNGTYGATVSRQSAGTFVKYKVLAVDAAENQAEVSGNYSVKNPTQIEISLSKYICNVDETVSVDGSISHGGALVTLNYTSTNTEVLRSARADSNGIFSDLYGLANFGIWKISASWLGNETCFGAVSNSESLAVSKIIPSLTCNVTAKFLNLGEKISVNGSINPPITLAQIRIVFTRHNGSTVETSEYTYVNGTFGTEFTPDSAGPWEVVAKFGGDSIRYGASQSYPISFVVEEKSIFNMEFFIYIGVAGATGAVALVTVMRMRRGRGEV